MTDITTLITKIWQKYKSLPLLIRIFIAVVVFVISIKYLFHVLFVFFVYRIFKSHYSAKVKTIGIVFLLLTLLPFASVWLNAFNEALSESTGKESVLEVKQNGVVNNVDIDKVIEASSTPQEETKEVQKAVVEEKIPDQYLVTRVIDGDTIEIEGGQHVRYIGIDTPETVNPNTAVECYGTEASIKNKELVEGKKVILEKDVSETDKYGRLLRYVWLGELLVNDYLVKEGYANSSTYPPDVKYQDRFLSSENEARASAKGLWSSCNNAQEANENNENTVTPPPAVASPKPVTSTKNVCKYSCSGPDRDCADFATHSEAQSFFNCCGFTATNDPMKLDGTGVDDGIACESLP